MGEDYASRGDRRTAPSSSYQSREEWQDRDYDYGARARRDTGSFDEGRSSYSREGPSQYRSDKQSYGEPPAHRDQPAYGRERPSSYGDGYSRESHSGTSSSNSRVYGRDDFGHAAYGKGSKSSQPGGRGARLPPRAPVPKKEVDPLDAFMAGIEVAGDSFAKGEVT